MHGSYSLFLIYFLPAVGAEFASAAAKISVAVGTTVIHNIHYKPAAHYRNAKKCKPLDIVCRAKAADKSPDQHRQHENKIYRFKFHIVPPILYFLILYRTSINTFSAIGTVVSATAVKVSAAVRAAVEHYVQEN